MIEFDFKAPLNWAILALLVGILAVQLGFILRNPTLSFRKKAIKSGLNGAVWLILVAFILQPIWKYEHRVRHVSIVGKEVPATFVRTLAALPPQDDYQEADSVTLVGAGFSDALMSQLSGKSLRWIPYQPVGLPDQLQWKGILRKGEKQHITGQIMLDNPAVLKIAYGKQILDSLSLPEGTHPFRLSFPSFVQGKVQTELLVDNKVADTVRFFSTSVPTLHYQIVLSNPDFESKTLAEYLGKAGHSVRVEAQVSKDMQASLQLNRSGNPDVIITDPDQVGQAQIKKAYAEGKSILFINVTNPEVDARKINQSLGTHFQVRKISNEPGVTLSSKVNALPYQFISELTQTDVAGVPVAIQKRSAKVGLSFLSETYPLRLAGDSLIYDQIWSGILQNLQPGFSNNVTLSAPLYPAITTLLQINNSSEQKNTIALSNDTLTAKSSVINPHTLFAELVPRHSGWFTLQDTLAAYVEQPTSAAFQKARIQQYLRSYTQPVLSKATSIHHVPDWLWFLVLVLGFTALWIEAKFT
ncbi:MAG: hypothetical protein QM669_00280 [Siphonobacter sp.]